MRKELLAYCGMDTLAMVKFVSYLRQQYITAFYDSIILAPLILDNFGNLNQISISSQGVDYSDVSDLDIHNTVTDTVTAL